MKSKQEIWDQYHKAVKEHSDWAKNMSNWLSAEGIRLRYKIINLAWVLEIENPFDASE